VHPHRGFETVTVVYAGELEHRDSTGNGGRIGPGDVQWMTAASGILHEEFHSERFTREGGLMSMMQLWVNLPAQHKMAKPRYQTILDASIPRVALDGDAGRLRVIAERIRGKRGPARHSPRSRSGTYASAQANGTLRHRKATRRRSCRCRACTRQWRRPDRSVADRALAREGGEFTVTADGELWRSCSRASRLRNPSSGYGPFVMNSEREIAAAFADFQSGRFGQM
jgi:redox-sensitive bicupin YhaK (pirin superfamily)